MKQDDRAVMADALESTHAVIADLIAQLAAQETLLAVLLRRLDKLDVVSRAGLLQDAALMAEVSADAQLQDQLNALISRFLRFQ